jgi:iron complex outermembrane receptor protein
MMTITLGNVRAVARFAACAVLLCATGALAQQAAEPAQELPPLEVTAKKSAQKKAAAKKAQAKAAPKAAPQPAAPEPQSEQPAGVTNGLPPVEGYVATEATTGTKTDTPLRETPQSISVVGKEQMRDQGVQSIQEAVRYVPGVLADGFGVDSRNDFSVIRGTAAAYYIDGLRKTYGYWANTATIEPYALERVEVLRGPASMIYGQTPAGGLINGISKLPLDTPYTEIGVDYGSFDFKQVRFDSTGTVTTDGKWLYRITGLARDADTQVDSVENDRYMIQPSITYRPTNDTSITFLGNLRKDDTGSTQQFLPAVGTLTPVPGFGRVPRDAFMGNPDDYHRVEEQSATLLVDHKFSSALSLHHGMRYTHNEVDFDTNYPLIITQPRVDTFNALLGFPIFNADNAPFLGSNLSPGFLGPILPRVRTVERNDTEVFNTDTYLTARFDTGPVQHKLMGGVDYMHYSTDRASANLIDNLVLDPGPG